MDNRYFNILAHPTGRLIGERPGYAVDLERVMQAAKERRCFLEIANPSAIEFKRRTQEADRARRLEDEANFFKMMEDREQSRAALMSIFALGGREYRPDWRETLLIEDRGRASADQTLVLGAHSTARITSEIE